MKYFLIGLFFLTFQAYAIDAPEYVYRIDTRSPEEIRLAHGFKPRGSNRNLVAHITRTGETPSAFVATTSSIERIPSIATAFMRFNPRASSLWVYTIRADNRFYNAEITLEHIADTTTNPTIETEATNAIPIAISQSEWFAIRAISLQQIRYATPIAINDNREITHIDLAEGREIMPHYNPTSSSASLEPYSSSTPAVVHQFRLVRDRVTGLLASTASCFRPQSPTRRGTKLDCGDNEIVEIPASSEIEEGKLFVNYYTAIQKIIYSGNWINIYNADIASHNEL